MKRLSKLLVILSLLFSSILFLSYLFINDNTKLDVNSFTVNLYIHSIEEKELINDIKDIEEYILYTIEVESQKENIDENIFELEINEADIIDTFSKDTLDSIFTNYIKKRYW